MKIPLLLTCIIVASVAMASQEELPFSAAKARQQYEQRIEKAQERYMRSAQLAQRDYIAHLNGAMEAATREGKLDDALAIKAERERVETAGVPMPTGAPGNLDVKKLRPGLVGRTFARMSQQVGNNTGFVAAEDFKSAIGNPFLVKSSNWSYEAEHNAVASGFLLIEEAGEYAFRSNNFYDRNALYINDELLCGYRDGEGTIRRISLPKGYVPYVSVGYVDARGTVEVLWQPPGREGLVVIPEDRLFHAPLK